MLPMGDSTKSKHIFFSSVACEEARWLMMALHRQQDSIKSKTFPFQVIDESLDEFCRAFFTIS